MEGKRDLLKSGFQSLNRTTVLLRARLAVFEMCLHVAPPGWRLKGERKNLTIMERLYKGKVNKKQIILCR